MALAQWDIFLETNTLKQVRVFFFKIMHLIILDLIKLVKEVSFTFQDKF